MKKFILLISIFLVATPVFAKVNGGISHDYIYDVEKTIMFDVKPKLEIKNSLFWDTNYFYSNKFYPAFILSNKDMYTNFSKPAKTRILRPLVTPSVYNISLKNSSVKKVSFNSTKYVQTGPHNANELYEKAIISNNITKKINTALVLKNSNSQLALSLLDNVLKYEPNNAHAYFLRGEIYYKQNHFEKSMENFSYALQLNPQSYQCCLGIAKILDRTNHSLAQKYYDRANELR